jgi:ribosomal protein S18 acetylase RimI-like enzyme
LGTTPDQLLKTFHHPEYQVHLAMADGHRAGVLVIHPRGLASSPYIKSIAVASSFQNRGIGEQLMAFAESNYGREAKHLFLCVSSFNLRAQKFYRRLGYETVGEFRDYVIEGESELLLHKRIS